MSIYTDNGFANRNEYLNDLAFEYDIDSSTVFLLADILGDNEDFDGLITSLEDYDYFF